MPLEPSLFRSKIHWADISVMSIPASDPPGGQVTRLLADLRAGKSGSEARLFELLYDELRTIAKRHMRKEGNGHTLQTTALVHEAYLRLFGNGAVEWTNKAHFLSVTAQVMRRILVDHARGRRATKRGGGAVHTEINEMTAGVTFPIDQILAVDEALSQLAALEPRSARMVELHLFAGLTLQETAEVLGVCVRTVKRDWEFAQAWLGKQVRK